MNLIDAWRFYFPDAALFKFDLCQRPPHYSLSAAHFAFPMHILNADVLSSILFSWCKSKLANIINTEKLLVCLQFAYIGRFFFKTQIDQLPEEMHSMALAKKLLGWCCWSCEDSKSHEYQHNIKALIKGPVIITAGWDGG